MALKDSVCVREPARVPLQHSGGLASIQLDQHGALGLVHFELEGFDCIQKVENKLVRSSQVSLATDSAMHREVIGIPRKKFLDSAPAEDADKGVQESARENGEECRSELASLFDASGSFNILMIPLRI